MLASRRAATGRQRVIVAASMFAAIVASGLAGAAYVQWKRAERSYGAALTNLDHLIKDLAGEMQNAQGMPVSTIDRILKNGQVLAEDLQGDSKNRILRGLTRLSNQILSASQRQKLEALTDAHALGCFE
jgi:uncharacterized membrane protein YqiK